MKLLLLFFLINNNNNNMNVKTATFGSGCFWCTEAIFELVEGVVNVESGYSAGKALTSYIRLTATAPAIPPSI